MGEYFVEKEIINNEGIEFFSQSNKKGETAAKAHIHSAIEMLFITEGNYRVFSNEREYTVEEGDFVLFRSGTIHRIYAEGENNSYFVIKIRPPLVFDFSSKSSGSAYVMELSLDRNEARQRWTADEAKESGISEAVDYLIAENGNKSVGRDMAMRIGAAKLLLAVLRSISENEGLSEGSAVGADVNNRIYRVITKINENYSLDLTALELAREVGMSYSYFSRCFSKVTGRSFKEYLNRVRVDRAEKELMTTDKSVTEISTDCGYNNVSYFISSYKKIKGKTPSSFRNGK